LPPTIIRKKGLLAPSFYNFLPPQGNHRLVSLAFQSNSTDISYQIHSVLPIEAYNIRFSLVYMREKFDKKNEQILLGKIPPNFC